MNIRQAERKQAKIKLAIQGCSGSGKTYSGLLLAFGITNNWKKIAVIDSENGSADLYAHLGAYNVLNLNNNFSPENYLEALTICEKAGMEVIIIDSLSQSWDFLLQCHTEMSGNSFTNWGKITPRQNGFIQRILQSNSHVICTMRTKQDYVLSEKNGRLVPEKVGLKAIMRDGVEYEFTIVLDVDIKHIANASKDRTGLFMGNPDFMISNATGQRILNWCNSGKIVENVKTEIPKVQNNEESNSIKQPEKEWFPFIDTDFENQNPPNIVPEIIKPVIIYKSNYLRDGNNNAIIAS